MSCGTIRFCAVLAGKLEARRSDCAPRAGKSTLNRLELSRNEPTRYHKVSHDAAKIETLLVDVFLEAHSHAPGQIILDLDATDDLRCTASKKAGSSTVIMIATVTCRSTSLCGRHLLAGEAAAVKHRRLGRRGRGSRTHCRGNSADAGHGFVSSLRGDPGFARETLMAWCEANRVDFLFGMARNERLEAAIKDELDDGGSAEHQGRQVGASLQGLLHLLNAG